MNVQIKPSTSIVIFGGTGDLSHRKLLPALYRLAVQNLLPEHYAILFVGRRPYDDESYQEELKKWIPDRNDTIWDALKGHIHYYQMDFTKEEEYPFFKQYLSKMDELHYVEMNHIFYFAVAPQYFDVLADNLNKYYQEEFQKKQPLVVIEKPFGRDLHSAKLLNQKLAAVFKEENVYRIDHYLAKEMFQNIMVIRFANHIFESLWDNQHIEQVQISLSETFGIATRGEYYEHSGATRDMLQSHMLQLVSLIAMEQPKSLTSEAIRDQKVKVLRALRKYNTQEVLENVVRGQYEGYREEKNVKEESETETFVALKLEVNNARWRGVPFYLRTGKKMKNSSMEIMIQFLPPKNDLYEERAKPNRLFISIQPKEGVTFEFNTKEMGSKHDIAQFTMDYCHNCHAGINTPEAYERLLYDVMNHDATLFARWDEVEASWEYIDHILHSWEKETPQFPNYVPGSNGPKAADDLLKKDGKEWYDDENL